MALKMPSPAVKKDCAAILESMKVCFVMLHYNFCNNNLQALYFFGNVLPIFLPNFLKRISLYYVKL